MSQQLNSSGSMFWGHLKQHELQAPVTKEPSHELQFRTVLRVTIATIRDRLQSQAKQYHILRPPGSVVKGLEQQFIQEEDPNYLVRMREQKVSERTKHGILWEQAKSHMRVDDKVRYVFDRRSSTKQVKSRQTKSIHCGRHVTNRRPRTSSSSVTTGKPNKARKAKLKPSETKMNWLRMNQMSSKNEILMLNHLLGLVQQEQQNELRRETELLDTRNSRKQRLHVAARICKERSEAADWLMRILQSYGVLSNGALGYYLAQAHKVDNYPNAQHLNSMTKDYEVHKSDFVPFDFTVIYEPLGNLAKPKARSLRQTRIDPPNPLVAKECSTAKECIQYGGWGKRLSHEAETILSNPMSKSRDCFLQHNRQHSATDSNRPATSQPFSTRPKHVGRLEQRKACELEYDAVQPKRNKRDLSAGHYSVLVQRRF